MNGFICREIWGIRPGEVGALEETGTDGQVVMESGGGPTVTERQCAEPGEGHGSPVLRPSPCSALSHWDLGRGSPWGSLGFICHVGWYWPWTFAPVIIWHSILSRTGAEMQWPFPPSPSSTKSSSSLSTLQNRDEQNKWGVLQSQAQRCSAPPPHLPVVWLILEKALLRLKIFC